MNPNYLTIVKHNLDKLLVVSLIEHVEDAQHGCFQSWWCLRKMGNSKFSLIDMHIQGILSILVPTYAHNMLGMYNQATHI
jgi:hypothetical protein